MVHEDLAVDYHQQATHDYLPGRVMTRPTR